MEDQSVIVQNVNIAANVTVESDAKIGEVHASCVGQPTFEQCAEMTCDCTYMVSQMICVKFPMTISATASAKPAGIICEDAFVEPCSNKDVKLDDSSHQEESLSDEPVKERICAEEKYIETQGAQDITNLSENMQEIDMPDVPKDNCKSFEKEEDKAQETPDAEANLHEKGNMQRRRPCGYFPPLCFPPFCCCTHNTAQAKNR